MIEVKSCSPESISVALLYGGKSSERDISIKSAESVSAGLKECGFRVVEIDTGEPHYIDQLESLAPDVVFNCLHGKGGEDGCVQGVCSELGIPCTGSGVLASALAMDKARAKVFFSAFGINTPRSATLHPGMEVSYFELAAELGAKIVIKPSCEGSAFGVSIVNNADDFGQALSLAFEHDASVVVEQFIAGKEVTVAIIGNDELEALPVIEIVPHAEFYDFEAKYAQGGSDHICPARIDDDLTRQCQEMSKAAHVALGCRGVSRSDIIIDGAGVPWMLETNTIPGMTKTSLIPDAARAAGMDFPTLCKTIVELALEDFGK